MLGVLAFLANLPANRRAAAQGVFSALFAIVVTSTLLANPTAVFAQDFLDPALAFKAQAEVSDSQTVTLRYDIAKGYYLYRDKFKVKVLSPNEVQLGAIQSPAGKPKHDENFGQVEVFYGNVNLTLPLSKRPNEAFTLKLKLISQGCADAGICYPPQGHEVSVNLPATGDLPDNAHLKPSDSLPLSNSPRAMLPGGGDSAAPAMSTAPTTTSTNTGANANTNTPSVAAATAAPPKLAGNESGWIAAQLKGASLWVNIFFFFVAGLGLALTPCVFPMIPILSGIIVGQGHKASRSRAFSLALAYVLGMAVTYALAGVMAGLTGTLLANALQNAWVLAGFAAIFVFLAGSMLGFYELQLPTSLQTRLTEGTGHFQGGRGVGVFLMGALSALIVGPCVAAPLAGALLYISQTGDALLGGLALFAMALGMGVPLLAVGLSAGTLLPRTGPWMENVKQAFGVLLLATAVWILSPVLPVMLVMLFYGALLIIPAIYLNALEPLPSNAKPWKRFWKGVGLLLFITGVILWLGAFGGSKDPLQPLAVFGAIQGVSTGVGATGNDGKHAGKLAFTRVKSTAELDSYLHKAHQPVLLDFYADWCVSCKEMERFTFSDSKVQAALANYTLLQVDVTDNNDDDQALLKRFKLFGPPGIIFFNAQGQELATPRVVGFQNSETFLQTLAMVGK